MSHTGPYFHAWSDDKGRLQALAAAVTRLCTPKAWDGPPSLEEALHDARVKMQADFDAEGFGSGGGTVLLPSGDELSIWITGWRDKNRHGYPGGPLLLEPEAQHDLLFLQMPIARGGICSVELESAIFAVVTLENTVDLLLRLCAPDETSRVTTGACTWLFNWGQPLEACATYNADANVARDIVLSWLNGYDKTPIEQIAGLELNALRARIAATPETARARVARVSSIEHVDTYTYMELPDYSTTPVPGMQHQQSAGYVMSRDQIMQVLDTPRDKLLDALEAAAVPDAEWAAVESGAIESIEAKKQGAPCDEVPVNSRRHIRFLEQHAPYHVRRLPNGGVMLATHPYRTLWQLWADALALLGIRP
jgi:hypothetical protein